MLVAAWIRRRAEWLWAPALYVVVVAILYREIWIGEDGVRHWFGWDCPESYWPDLAYYANALRQGHWPFWNPYDRGGYAFYGDTVIGLYYPVSWGFVVPGAVFGGMPAWTIQVKALLHHALLGGLLHVFARSRGLSRPAAIFAGVVGIVSGPIIIHKASALFWPMVWAPLIWVASDRAIERVREPAGWRRGAALGGVVGLAGLAGPPPGFFYILLACLGYGALRLVRVLVEAHRVGQLRVDAARLGRDLAIAAGVAVALLAITMIPAAHVAAESPRAARSLGYALSNPMPIGTTLRSLVTPASGKIDGYLGVLALAFAVLALVRRPRADGGAPIFFAVAATFAFLLSFGGNTPILPFLVEHVPGFGLFREANRYKVLGAILFPVTAAYGVETLAVTDRSGRRALLATLGVLFVTLAVIALALAVPSPLPKGQAPRGVTLVILGLGLAAAVGAVLLQERHLPLANLTLLALAAIAAVDVATFGRVSVRITELPTDDQEDRRFLAGLADVEREWRVFDEYVMEQRPGSRLLVRDFRGYPAGDPFEDVRYREVLARASHNPELLEAFNVRYVLHGPHHRNGVSSNYVKVPPIRTAPLHFRALDGKRFEALHPVPLAAWYGGVVLAPDKTRAMTALLASEAPDGVRRQAVVERADAPAALAQTIGSLTAVASPPPLVPGTLRAYTPNQIAFDIDAPSAGVVVLNEKLHRGWQVSVDGQAAVPFRANYLSRAVLVGPGRHTITWRFAPASYPALVAAWAAAVVFLAGAAAWPWLRRARRPWSTP